MGNMREAFLDTVCGFVPLFMTGALITLTFLILLLLSFALGSWGRATTIIAVADFALILVMGGALIVLIRACKARE